MERGGNAGKEKALNTVRNTFYQEMKGMIK